MRIVLDTNVLVSGLISPYGAPAVIVRMAVAGVIEVCLDARIISEYRAVLKRPKFKLDPAKVDVILSQIESCGYLVVAEPLPYRLVDVGDEPFLEVASAAAVDFLIAGNLKHYPAESRQEVKIVGPSQFIQIYRKTEHE